MICEHLNICWHLLIFVHICLHLFTSFSICQHLTRGQFSGKTLARLDPGCRVYAIFRGLFRIEISSWLYPKSQILKDRVRRSLFGTGSQILNINKVKHWATIIWYPISNLNSQKLGSGPRKQIQTQDSEQKKNIESQLYITQYQILILKKYGHDLGSIF